MFHRICLIIKVYSFVLKQNPLNYMMILVKVASGLNTSTRSNE
ncbi:hypothetical protein ACZ87_03543 [Candidatus Erwinia dacicola]|uniref:Uncharacterized protein n=1 Tax=Candidatus Erwinia dacicola TaxID=252393 RepID=A0A328TKZ2_9GAMM|nr:hypothetical protein ACZ87_03543 [Candidatus Erwinia dacicola]